MLLIKRNIEDRERALNAYITHRRVVEDTINEAEDFAVLTAFFVRNRVTNAFEIWRDVVSLRSKIVGV